MPKIIAVCSLFLFFNFLLRTVFSILHFDAVGMNFICCIFVGCLSDIVTLTYLFPFLLIALTLLNKSSPLHQFAFFFTVSLFFIFFAISEFLFWNEFSCRFNFISVDYLVYTKEVLGNIKESFNLPMIIAFAVISSSICSHLILRFYKFPQVKINVRFVGIAMALPCASFFLFKSSHLEHFENRYANEISKNGLYELFSAYRNNDLPFEKFYITDDQIELTKSLRNYISLDEKDFIFLGNKDISRQIVKSGKEKHLNIVLIVVESLGAEYLESFGNKEKLTPNLDYLLKKSLSFSNIKATGTRTVFGLSAISLSIPPTPGNAIIRRPDNENLCTLGNILGSKGYDCKFIYGGFGYFDNMNYFFKNNGYRVIDRAKIDSSNITFANIWGICDEDLFRVVLDEADKSYKTGKPFFSTVMTTSNHRPYTYPEGKIDIPSKSGRSGGVKYSDFAIGDFIKKASGKPWFNKTIFIITADHTAGSAGKISLDPKKYHIPFFIYSPSNVKPATIDALASQIDIAPTILSLLNMSYKSKFFGHDILSANKKRAFISNYQQVGYLTDSELIVLKPVKQHVICTRDGQIGDFSHPKGCDHRRELLKAALQFFQSATNWKSWNRFEKPCE